VRKHEVVAAREAEAGGHAGNSGETGVHVCLAADCTAAEPAQESVRVRAFHDELARRTRELSYDRLITAADDAPVRQIVEQPVFERGIDREPCLRARA
jgi:hypothetical protein